MLPQSLFLEICASLYIIPFCWIKEFNQYNGNEIYRWFIKATICLPQSVACFIQCLVRMQLSHQWNPIIFSWWNRYMLFFAYTSLPYTA